jgi:peptide/nickel transport system permease protein
MVLAILRRLLSGLLLIVTVTAITFFLVNASGVDAARGLLGPAATQDDVAALRTRLGLDQSVLAQYADWLGSAARGDLGTSWFTSEPVGAALASRIPVTLSIVLVATILTAIVSVALGATAARRGGVVDKVLQLLTLIGYALPGLLIAIILVSVFALQLDLFAATGYVPITQSFTGWLGSILLPSIALTFGGVAVLAAQIRGAMVDELAKDYVRTLRSRGLSSRAIVLRHVLRNAAAPSLTVLSVLFISMFGGAVIIERIFALPGFGQFVSASSLQGDIPVIMGAVTFTVVVVVVVNLVIDLANAGLNPKARTR